MRLKKKEKEKRKKKVEMISFVLQNPNERVSVSYLTFSVPCEETTEDNLFIRTKLFSDVFQDVRTP